MPTANTHHLAPIKPHHQSTCQTAVLFSFQPDIRSNNHHPSPLPPPSSHYYSSLNTTSTPSSSTAMSGAGCQQTPNHLLVDRITHIIPNTSDHPPILANGAQSSSSSTRSTRWNQTFQISPGQPLGFGSELDEDERLEEEEDEDEAMTVAADEEYAKLTSLRDPSPSSNILFTAPSTEAERIPDYERLSIEDSHKISMAVCSLSTVVGNTFCSYQSTFSQWKFQDSKPSRSILKASNAADQAALKIIFSLEPLNQLITMIDNLCASLSTLETGLDPSLLDPTNSNGINQFWTGLSDLSDQMDQIEDNLQETTYNINELYLWTDEILTPIIAELKIPPNLDLNKNNPHQQLSLILDAHSYLCASIDKICWNLKLIDCCFKKISRSVYSFKQAILPRFKSDERHQDLKVEDLIDWSRCWKNSLGPIKDCLIVLFAISSAIQSNH